MERVMSLAAQSPVVIINKSSCVSCNTVKTLFADIGVSSMVHDLDEDPSGKEIEEALLKLLGSIPPIPAVASSSSSSSCVSCNTVKTLFADIGVSSMVQDLDEDPSGKEMEEALLKLLGSNPPIPAVFIGGALKGSTNEIMSLQLSGALIPLLKEAGALWV
ncbi:hypothetical protein HHK36_006655 [Tetracentron sinense]|uniref:Glutaredoxin domain-containing protein n=1 Tax=Tetracentron sinense TaxID=13715 RepID=A0A835DL53_TETSI|nr:hypothetical protein HHK36_006655 [Tetracentron sinense]